MRNPIDSNHPINLKPNKPALFIFDFRLSDNDDWLSSSSSDKLSDFGPQVLSILKHGGQYRIIEIASGKIVQSNTKTMRRSSCQKLPKP